MGLFAALGGQPLIPAIGRHDTTGTGEGVLEVARRGHGFRSRIDRLCRLTLGPFRPVAPPKIKMLGWFVVRRLPETGDPSARRNVVACRWGCVGHCDAQALRERGIGIELRESSTHEGSVVELMRMEVLRYSN